MAKQTAFTATLGPTQMENLIWFPQTTKNKTTVPCKERQWNWKVPSRFPTSRTNALCLLSTDCEEADKGRPEEEMGLQLICHFASSVKLFPNSGLHKQNEIIHYQRGKRVCERNDTHFLKLASWGKLPVVHVWASAPHFVLRNAKDNSNHQAEKNAS